MKVNIEKSWAKVLKQEFEEEYFIKLTDFVKREYTFGRTYPKPRQIFNAFDLCPFDKIKVVIIGQDPYHGVGQANGLCFSVNDGVRLPPSLQNIFKELRDDLGIDNGHNGDLSNWAKQGVLMLNATLTVMADKPGSHQGKGWEKFTDNIIKIISDKKDKIVFILWGAYAQKKSILIDEKKHNIISSPHPSPFSAERGFFGSNPFSKTNAYLKENSLTAIDWQL